MVRAATAQRDLAPSTHAALQHEAQHLIVTDGILLDVVNVTALISGDVLK